MSKATVVLCTGLLLWAAPGLTSNPLKIIVFPLDGSVTDGPLSWLGEGIALSLSGQLGSSRVQVVNRDKRIEATKSLYLPLDVQLSKASLIRIAQQASADLVIMGVCEGTAEELRISARVLDMKSYKLSGEMSANGPLAALPQMENELAWLILTNTGIEKSLSRQKYQSRMRKIPNTAFALYIQGLTALEDSEKIRLYLKAIQAYRDFPEAQFRLGEIYLRKGDCTSAISHLELGKCESAANPSCEFMLGACYLKGNQPDRAIQAFSQLLTASRSFEVLNNLGVAYLRAGDKARALDAFTEAANLAHGNSTVLLNLALAQFFAGDGRSAQNVLRKSAKESPDDGMLQLALGYLLEDRGDHQEAAAALNRARILGVNVEQLLGKDPETWLRIFPEWQSQTGNAKSESRD